MTDIVDLVYRLRGLGYKACNEAADEIERLREERKLCDWLRRLRLDLATAWREFRVYYSN